MLRSAMLPAMLLASATVTVHAQDTAAPDASMQAPSPDTSMPAPSAPDGAMPAPGPSGADMPDPNANMPTGPVPPEANGMQPADPSQPLNPTAPVGSAQNPAVMGGNMTAPPTAPKDYPVCSRTITDSCINPGDARKSRKNR